MEPTWEGGETALKQERQAAIRRMLEERAVRTQDELAEALAEEGFRVTQATVSRDIKEMHLVKAPAAEGGYRYAAPEPGAHETGQRLSRLLADCVTGVEAGGQMIVVRTLSGSASAAAEALDRLGMPEIMGSIAGDNTVFLAARDPDGATAAGERIRRMARREAEPGD